MTDLATIIMLGTLALLALAWAAPKHANLVPTQRKTVAAGVSAS